MSIKRMACVLAAVSVAAGACSDDEGSSPEVSGGNKQIPTAGSIALGLEVAPGVDIDSVDYEVTGTGIAPPITGSLALGDGVGTTFVANINGIPGGTGRLLTLNATGSNGTTCTGSATFDTTNGQTSNVNVVLHCQTSGGAVIVNGSFDQCPLVRSCVAAPATAPVGGSISVSVDASDPEGGPVAIQWSASAGSFEDPTAASTHYTCTAAGVQTITVTVVDSAECANSLSLLVTCIGGVDAGTCGNGTIDSTEACDGSDLGGQTCASITMGAQPDGTLSCTADCQFDITDCSAGGEVDSGTGGADSGIGGADSGTGTGGAP